MRTLNRALLVLCAFTWWVLPGMGVIDLSVTWDPGWPVMLEAGWGVLFTAGLGLPFLLAGLRPAMARASLAQLYVVTSALLAGVVLGLEPQSWWIFLGLLLEVPLVHAVAPPARLAWSRPQLPLLALAVVAAPIGLVYAWDMADLNRHPLFSSDITNGVDHYAVQAALGLALVALPAVGSALPGGRRLLGTSTALMASYLGFLSYHWPGAEGGFNAAWSSAVMLWSVAVLAAAWWPDRGSSVDASSLARGV